MTRPCDCLDACGDDPALAKGIAVPCARYVKWKNSPLVQDATHDPSNPKSIVLHFDRELDDDQIRTVLSAVMIYCWRSP